MYNSGYVAAAVPDPVARLLRAANANDINAFLAGFTDDGVVDDWGREFACADAIPSWSDDDRDRAGRRRRVQWAQPLQL